MTDYMHVQRSNDDAVTDDQAIIAAWEFGDISDIEALRLLCSDLGEVESDLEPLQAERERLRSTIDRIVTKLGGKANVKGFGTLQITGGGETTSYDAKACDALIAKLAANGYAEIAEELAQARRTSQRKASLRIMREKAK